MELTFAQIAEAVADASPATLEVAAKDVQWIMQHDDDKHSLTHWVAECLKIGAVAKKRSIEYTIATRAAKERDKKQAANIEAFAKYILLTPDVLKDLAKLIEVAAKFEIPTNLVLEYYNRSK